MSRPGRRKDKIQNAWKLVDIVNQAVLSNFINMEKEAQNTPITTPIKDTIKSTPFSRESYGYIDNDTITSNNPNSINMEEGSSDSSNRPQSKLEQTELRRLPALHDCHRLRWIYTYLGAQPVKEAYSTQPFFRDGSGKQAEYHRTRTSTIQTWPRKTEGRKTFHIWIHHPQIGKGKTEPQQLVWAKQETWRVVEEFSRHFGLADLRMEQEPDWAEWIVKNKALDGTLRPVIEAEPDLAQRELGLSINKWSHPDKVEWTGRDATKKIMELRYLLSEGMEELKTLAPAIIEMQKQNLELIRSNKIIAESVRLIQDRLLRGGKL